MSSACFPIIPKLKQATNRSDYLKLTKETRRVHCGIGRSSKLNSEQRDIGRVWLKRAGFRWTKHLQRRIQKYHRCLSRRPKGSNKQYIEINDAERNILGNLHSGTSFINTSLANGHFKIVEVGFNAYNEICKFGIVLLSPMYLNDRSITWGNLEVSSKRVMFLCIGLDRGLKTMYITPGYKERTMYACKYK